ncbi:MAG: hypothetical protein ACUVTR_02745 [Dehalococcoidia bacterium]
MLKIWILTRTLANAIIALPQEIVAKVNRSEMVNLVRKRLRGW